MKTPLPQSIKDGVHRRIHDLTQGYVKKGGKRNRRYMVHLMHVFADFALTNGHRTLEEMACNRDLLDRFCDARCLSTKTRYLYARALDTLHLVMGN